MKRRTKEQREALAKAALRQRIADIATGAAGFEFDNGDEWATAEFLSRFIPALKVQFGWEKHDEVNPKVTESNNWLWSTSNLAHYENVDTTTEFLFEQGVRA